MRLRSGLGIHRLKKNLMRKFVVVITLLLIVSAAPNARADDATKLYQALLSKRPKHMPEGFSSASLARASEAGCPASRNGRDRQNHFGGQ